MKDGKMVMLAVVGIVLFAGIAPAAELTVTIQGTGDGIVIGDEIYCEPDCTRTYPDESIVHLKAVPDDWSEFKGWLVDGEPQEGAIVIRKDITVTAIFEKIPIPDFETVGTRPADLPELQTKGVFPLYDSGGEVVGSWQTIWPNDIPEKVISIKDGASFSVYPLNGVLVSKDRNRVIAYGGITGDVNLSSPIYVKIYSSSGELITSVDTDMWSLDLHPSIRIEDNGGFWVAGIKMGTKDSFFLKRFSSDGKQMWESPFPMKYLRGIVLSLDHEHGILVVDDFSTRLSEIRLYKKDGTLLYERELPRSFYGAKFISNQNVLFYSADEWELYRLDDLETPVLSGRFHGNPHEILVVPQENSFIIKSYDEEQSQEGWRLQAVDSETGQILAERFFEEYPSEKNFQIFRITDIGLIELLVDNETIIELKIPR